MDRNRAGFQQTSRRSIAMQQHLIKNVCISVKAGWCSLQINRRSSFHSLPMCSQWWLDWKTTTVRQTGQRQSEPCRLCVCSRGRINGAQSDILSHTGRQCTVQPCIQDDVSSFVWLYIINDFMLSEPQCFWLTSKMNKYTTVSATMIISLLV